MDVRGCGSYLPQGSPLPHSEVEWMSFISLSCLTRKEAKSFSVMSATASARRDELANALPCSHGVHDVVGSRVKAREDRRDGAAMALMCRGRKQVDVDIFASKVHGDDLWSVPIRLDTPRLGTKTETRLSAIFLAASTMHDMRCRLDIMSAGDGWVQQPGWCDVARLCVFRRRHHSSVAHLLGIVTVIVIVIVIVI